MKKYHIFGIMPVFALILMTASAAAQEEISYSYAELGYVAISDGSSIGARAQYEFRPQIYVFGGYTYSEIEFTLPPLTTSIETNAGFLGFGYHMPVLQGIDLHGGYVDVFGELGYMMGTATVEASNGITSSTLDTDIKGVVGAVGARAFVMPKLEVEGAIGFAPEDFGGLNLLGRYHFQDNFSVAGGIIEGDLGIRLRASF